MVFADGSGDLRIRLNLDGFDHGPKKPLLKTADNPTRRRHFKEVFIPQKVRPDLLFKRDFSRFPRYFGQRTLMRSVEPNSAIEWAEVFEIGVSRIHVCNGLTVQPHCHPRGLGGIRRGGADNCTCCKPFPQLTISH